MKAAIFTGDRLEHVCPQLRIFAPLRHAGVAVEVGTSWANGVLDADETVVDSADLVVIQRDFPRHRDAYRRVIERARNTGKRIIYELDDLLTEMPEDHPDHARYESVRFDILRALIEADAVTVPTECLKSYVSPLNPHVRILPNFLIGDIWGESKTEKLGSVEGSGRISIGYVGGLSHLPDLELIAPVLEAVISEHSDKLTLEFWGISPPDSIRRHPTVRIHNLGIVDYGKFAEVLRKAPCDIYLAPLRESQFNQCKSAIKFLEYSSVGRPGVYSKIGPYKEIVIDGENGLLASTLEDWHEALTLLIRDAGLRRRLGTKAQDTVRSGWLLEDHASSWAERFEEVMALGSNHRPGDHTEVVIQRTQSWYEEVEAKLAQQARSSQSLKQHARSWELETRKLQVNLAKIKRNPAWKLLRVMARTRNALLPSGSKRLAAAGLLRRTASLMREQGIMRTARKAAAKTGRVAGLPNRIYSRFEPDPQNAASPIIEVIVVSGEAQPGGDLCILVLQDAATIESFQERLMAWLGNQTLVDVTVKAWSGELGHLRNIGEPQEEQEARELGDVLERIGSDYLCIASEDLLAQDSSYLETNLLVLRTEDLAFTVNTRGPSHWLVDRLAQGYLPGDSRAPLSRTVARKELIGRDFCLDPNLLKDWAEARGGVIAKVIARTSKEYDVPASVPFTPGRLERAVHAIDSYLVLEPSGPSENRSHSHNIYGIGGTGLPARISEQPTVLMIMPFLALGGAERVAMDLIAALRDLIRFVVVTLEEHELARGTVVDDFRELTPWVYTTRDFLRPELNYSFLSGLIRTFGVQSLYIANGTTWIYDALYTIRHDFPELRIANQVYDHRAGWINRYDFALASSIDAHIGVNSRICGAYIQQGARPVDVFLIENGVNAEEYDPQRYSDLRPTGALERLDLPADSRVITFLSRIDPQKRPLDFLEMARRASADSSLFFLMVGDGPLASVVDDAADRLALDNFKRYPFHRPSSEIYAISDLLVLPSEFEGMPMVVLEAQAMGVPIVSTDVGNVREVLERTEGGLIVDTIGDPGRLLNVVYRALDTAWDREQIRRKVLENYSIEKMADGYLSALLGAENG